MTSAIDLFAGAGGLSLGLKMAGWTVDSALEFDPTALRTHQINMPRVTHLCADVRDVNFRTFKGIDLVAGGPPCQPFSVSGKQLGNQDLRDMVPEFVRAVREARPRAFLMENVHGLATGKFVDYLNARILELSKLGYDVHWDVLNAANYGVPQKRLRLFIAGVPKGTAFKFPTATHGGRRPFATVTAALAGCPDDEPNKAKVVYAKNPILRRSPFAGMLLNGKGRPLDLLGPSHTIPASAGGNRTHILDPNGVLRAYHSELIAGGKPRAGIVEGCTRLTVRQSARLQTFPDSFIFSGRRSQHYSQIGNAVPPDFAKVVAKALLDALRQNPAKNRRSKLVPDKSGLVAA